MSCIDALEDECSGGCCCVNENLSDYDKLEGAYGAVQDNWGDRDVFHGGYINLGYWKDFSPNKPISIGDRIKSARDLYIYILDLLQPTTRDRVLELGCGRGMGIADAVLRYGIREFIGLDALPAQVARARRNVSTNMALDGAKIELLAAPANATGQPDHSVDKVFSVEVMQHFNQFSLLAIELKRILKRGGRAVLTAHLSTTSNSVQSMMRENLLFGEGLIDVFCPIGDVVSAFEACGFYTTSHSIGAKVFNGFGQWLEQEHLDNVIGLNLCKSYKKGYIDYFVVTVNSRE
ncbi:MAG: methyltransferase domain-containing protein [Holosporaceae bacterium]|jgi:cyclopropane fatty-acyl-phospholipid synthase-like methyltransferase|nr:methyltransferase domain-containing protein [Holosporaceae bacterium]